MLDLGLIWTWVAGACLLIVGALYLWTVFFKPPRGGPPHTWLIVLIALSLSGCGGSRFYGVSVRPAEYGGGYVLVGETCDPICRPAWYLCSPEIGGKILCGPVPVEWW